MSVIEKFATISQTISNLMTFITQDELTLNAIEKIGKDEQIEDNVESYETLIFNFMVTGRVGEKNTHFVNYYLEKNPQTSDEEKKIINAINQLYLLLKLKK